MTGRTGSLRLLVACLAAMLAAALAQPASAARAPTPNDEGPYKVTSVEYRFPAKVDRLVTSAMKTEVWGVLWRPRDLGKRRHPIVVLVHGNHATCGRRIGSSPWRNDDRSDYTTTGKCPNGYVVVPNHRGYDYLARRLASWGTVVISVNLNRGINVAPDDPNDSGLILRRARMVLRHLSILADWNTGKAKPPRSLGFDPRNRLDFSRIALMGHSRGGDAIVAVPRVFASGTTWRSRLPKKTKFRLLMSLAPTDFQAARPAPKDAVYSVLLPLCDGDVSDMQGIRFFDRALKSTSEAANGLEKSSLLVWGTNHNGYSTEWHISDAETCVGQTPVFPAIGHSTTQQTIARNWMLGLVRSTLLGSKSMDRMVDPLFDLPSQIASLTPIDRGFVPTIRGRRLVHALDARLPGGCANKLAVTSGVTGSCTAWPEHDRSALFSLVRWGPPATGGSAQPAARIRAGSAGNLDLSASATLDVQFGPDCFRGTFGGALSCTGPSAQAATGQPSTFNQPVTVYLQDTSGRFSRGVRMDQRASSRGPVGSGLSQTTTKYHALMRTARIPMSSFGTGFSKRNVRYVWFDFSPTARGGFVIGEISGQTVKVVPDVPRVADAGDLPRLVADVGDPDILLEAVAMTSNGSGEGDAARIGSVRLPAGPRVPPASGDAAPEPLRVAAADTLPVPAADLGLDASRDRNAVVSVTRRRAEGPASAGPGAEVVRIEVRSSRPFPATGAGLTLRIGGVTVTAPDAIRGPAMDRAVFDVPAAVLDARARTGDPVTVEAWGSMPAWDFGGLAAGIVE